MNMEEECEGETMNIEIVDVDTLEPSNNHNQPSISSKPEEEELIESRIMCSEIIKIEIENDDFINTKCLLCLASLTSHQQIHEINQESAESLVCLLSLNSFKSMDPTCSSSYTEFFLKAKYCGMCSNLLSNIFKYLKSLMFLQEQLAISKAVLVELLTENYSEWAKDLDCKGQADFQNQSYSYEKADGVGDELIEIPAEELHVYPALFNEEGNLISDESNSLKADENTYSYEVEIVDQSEDEPTGPGGSSNDPLDLHVRNVAAYPGQQDTLTIILPDHHLQVSRGNDTGNGMYWTHATDPLGSDNVSDYSGIIQPNVVIEAEIPENSMDYHHSDSQPETKLHSHICTVCHKNFSSSGVLRTHMIIHGDKKFSCTICSKTFFYEHNLRTHNKTHGHTSQVNEHLQNQRNISSINHHQYEQKSPKNSKSLVIRNGANKNHTDPSFQFPCPRCNKTFRTKYNLNNHLFLHNNSANFKDSTSSSHEYSFTCGNCGKQYLSNENLQKHQAICNSNPSPDVKFLHDAGEINNRGISNTNQNWPMVGHVQQHSSNHLPTSPAKCPICDKIFYSENYVKIHMKTHGEEKPFRCNVCNKGFTLRHYLQVHLRVHTGEKPYSCKICGRNFTQKSSLNTHTRRHDTNFNYL